MADIVEISRPDSPKALARKYMLGQLGLEDYAGRKGGIYRAMQIADNAKNGMASMQALQFLADLAEIEREVDPNKNVPIKLTAIGMNADGNITPIASASA